MKSDQQRYTRAADEIAERLRKFHADIRPVIQQKHQLTEEMLDQAATRGNAIVGVELARKADLPLDELVAKSYQQSDPKPDVSNPA